MSRINYNFDSNKITIKCTMRSHLNKQSSLEMVSRNNTAFGGRISFLSLGSITSPIRFKLYVFI